MTNPTLETEHVRLELLHDLIHQMFENVGSDPEPHADAFDEVHHRMIDVIDPTPGSSVALDFFEEIKFAPISFPPRIAELVRRNDVFLVTMGLRNRRWKILYMSPPYAEGEC